MTRLIPFRILSTLQKDWPVEQLQVLRGLLNSPTAIYNALTLANDEMNTIKELDVALLQQYRHRIHLYFGEADDWVGKNKDTILKAFEADEENVKVAHGHPDIPHSFCISEYMYTATTVVILRPHILATRSRRGGRGAVF